MKTHEPWTREAAIAFCCEVEPLAAQCGAHVALTGGCLYGKGSRFRKDLDIFLFKHGGTATIETEKLFRLLIDTLGVTDIHGSGWRFIGTYKNKQIDFLFQT